MNPIIITEEVWANSQFSIARYYGRIKIDGMYYILVNKEGKDVFQLSAESYKAGREKAIEEGEPCDLCRNDFIPLYRILKRDRFIEILKEHPYSTDKEIKQIMRQTK